MTDWHDNAKFTRALRRAAKAANEASEAQGDLTDAFNERYGVTYSDVDADELIDLLDYGGNRAPTARECDRIMAENNHPFLGKDGR